MDALPTKLEIKREIALRKKQEKQEAYERRHLARQLLFGKAAGKSKNLPRKERLFVRSVAKEAYVRYLLAWNTGANYYNKGKKWRTPFYYARGAPMSFTRWRSRWWSSNLARYRSHDVPLLMKENFLEMQHGRSAAMRELREEGRMLGVESRSAQ